MPGRAILHIDANAFYASVEMQETVAVITEIHLNLGDNCLHGFWSC